MSNQDIWLAGTWPAGRRRLPTTTLPGPQRCPSLLPTTTRRAAWTRSPVLLKCWGTHSGEQNTWEGAVDAKIIHITCIWLPEGAVLQARFTALVAEAACSCLSSSQCPPCHSLAAWLCVLPARDSEGAKMALEKMVFEMWLSRSHPAYSLFHVHSWKRGKKRSQLLTR